MINKFFLSCLVCGVCLLNGSAQNLQDYETKITSYEPSEAYPFGRKNPNAPRELSQFEFMIGISDCQDSIRNPNGSWISFPSIWKAKYFLNGMAIQDNYFNPQNPTSNLRLFDPKSKTWKVTYVQINRGHFVGTWEGRKEENKIILKREQKTRDGDTVLNRLTFYNISKSGYDWVSEIISPDGSVQANWKQSCKKRIAQN